jgi:hypothetical protein
MKPITATELQKFIGKGGKYKLNGLTFDVAVADARTNYNVLELLVKPVAGEGESWVSASFITLDDPGSVPAQG